MNCREWNSFCRTSRKEKTSGKASELKDPWGYWTLLAHLLRHPYRSQSLFPGIYMVNLISLLSPWLPNPLLLSVSWNRRQRGEANAIMNIISFHSFFHWESPKPCPLSLYTSAFYIFTAQDLGMFSSSLLSLGSQQPGSIQWTLNSLSTISRNI